ncbi:MAG: hypothetical protein IJ347_09350, partial [Faecalibacterium sp.]|nr:hypothetical protein [Faecalibacterium sp.]
AQRKSEAKAEDKGEPEEAAAENEAGGRRKEIADETRASTEKSRPFLFCLPGCGASSGFGCQLPRQKL